MRIDLSLRRLKMFVEVVRQGGFSRAAEASFASQPTVSKAVRQLERELGAPLLHRIGQRAELTAAGEIVYRRALGLLAESENLVAELDDLRGLKRGRLRLGFARMGTSALFAPQLTSFRRRYPGVEVDLSVHNRKGLEEALRAGEVDLAGLVHPIAREFEWQDVSSDSLVALLPREHRFAGRNTVRVAKLAASPFILGEEGGALAELILGACREAEVTPKISARSSQVDFIFELVAAGVGIGFVPRAVTEQRPHRSVRAVRLDEPKCTWRVALAWRRGGDPSHTPPARLAPPRGEHPPDALAARAQRKR